ncbi:MAG: M20 family metallo-hydrolase [Desulfovibrionaceae bacterium]
MPNPILTHIAGDADAVVRLQTELVAIPALGPRNGGQGEVEKIEHLKTILAGMGVADVREFRAPDPDVACGYRPSLAAVLPGRNPDRTLWVIAHVDVVPPGDPTLWKTDPWTLVRDGDRLYGRGVEDNHQGLVSALLTARALLATGTTPDLNYGMLFAADEETGSHLGLAWLLREHPDLFGPDDLILVPDSGEPSGEMVEVAEKSMLWVKFTVTGKQCHGSTPDQGVNSLVAASDFILRVRTLSHIFEAQDPIFTPARSTFEPTMKEANVANVNTIPGKDVFYVDCRILPEYDPEEVLAAFDALGRGVEREHGVSVAREVVQREDAAPPTPVDAEIVQRTMAAVRAVYGNEPRPAGIGGGTVAAMLRRAGHPAVVWSRLLNNAHQPNESSSIAFTLGDAQVMALMLFD